MKFKENKSLKYKLVSCPHGKTDIYPLSGRYCKNNCNMYYNGCKRFK